LKFSISFLFYISLFLFLFENSIFETISQLSPYSVSIIIESSFSWWLWRLDTMHSSSR